MDLPEIKKSKSPIPWIVGVVAAVGIGAGVFTAYRIVQSPNQLEQLEELTVEVERKTLAVEIDASGEVEPIRKVAISPETTARLVELFVEQGDLVETGQTIAVMKSDRIQAQGVQAQANVVSAIANLQETQTRLAAEIAQAQARLAQAQASLTQAQERIPRQIEQAKAQLAAAISRLNLTEQRYQRYQVLVREGAEAQDQLDEALKNYQEAQASVIEARQSLQQLQQTGSPEIQQLQAAVQEARIDLEEKQRNQEARIAQLQAAVQESQAALKQIETQYEDTILKAPFDGIVTQKNASEGDIVSPSLGAGSSSIVEIAQGLKVVAQIPEVDIGQLEIGQPVNIVADAYPNQTFRGEVTLIAPEAIEEDNVTSFEVEIAIVTGLDELLSGMNVDVIFLGQQLDNALVVPTVAIVTEAGETGVMVVDEDNEPKFKPVTIGVTIEDQTQILSGIMPGERVFIDLPESEREEESN